MKNIIFIPSEDIKGSLNLELTINSGQTSQPSWLGNGNHFQEILITENQPTLINLFQDKIYSSLKLEVESKTNINPEFIIKEIRSIFDLDFNLPAFYDFLREDSNLSPTIDFCKGLRLFKAHNIFECLISSICSANNSIIRWNRSLRAMREKWGDGYLFSTGKFFTFPSPYTILKLPEHDIEEMEQCGGEKNLEECINNLKACGVGYRGKYMKQAAEIVSYNLDLDKLARMKYDDAFDHLLEIPGVGPKVADCILLYGYGKGEAFPTDVWIKRIISHLYFEEKDVPVHKIREFGQERFGEYAGYTQLYLFHYARKSGLLDKLKLFKKN